jgi:transcriptional regulator of acetoin/glycerol metabolism
MNPEYRTQGGRVIVDPEAISGSVARFPWARAKRDFEVAYLAALMRDCRGNMCAAERASGIDRGELYRKVKKLGLGHLRARIRGELGRAEYR